MADGEVIFNIVGDTSEYDKSIKKAEDTANSSHGKIKAGAVAAWAAVGTAVVAAGKLITDTIKQSVSLYSEYEQLAGGVETLFKESSGVVMDYAANAYKTAGLSANEYMATVTSFSASLLQSLGGDTEEAARMADMAITDMSDNANKMGTDMTAIQNAYQGFAKQNYTMLDNLKLGYGGTKEEMQRLIDDANKLREAQGLNADLTIDSYADVVEAIHTVQTEMGITGTTAKEAATTIQGSANMAKAAWQNLLTGLGDADANIGELVDNVVASFNTLLDNLIPVIENIISALPAVIEGLASALLEMAPTILSSVGEIISLLIDLIIESLPMLIDAGLQMIMALMEGLVQNAGNLADAAVEIVTSLATFLADNIDKIIDAAITLFTSFLTAILEPGNLQKLVEAAVKLVVSLVEGVIKAIPQLLQAAAQLISQLLAALAAAVGQLLQMGVQWITNLVQGIRNKISDVVQAGHDLAEQVKAKLREKISQFKQIGRDLLEGLKAGIKEKVSSIISSVTGAVSDAISAAKRLLGIASPSKVFKQMGQFMDEGLAQGVAGDAGKAIKAVVAMVSGAINGAISGVSSVYAGTGSSSYSTSNVFSIPKLSDSLTIRSDSDIDAIAEALYQRFMTIMRGRGQF